MLCPPGLSKSPASRFTGPPGGEWVLHGTATGQRGDAARPACDGECLLACRLRLLLLGLLVLLVVFLGVVAFAHDSFPRVVWGSRYKTGAESSYGRAIWATGFSLLNCMPGLPSQLDQTAGTAEVSSQWLFLLPRPTAAHSPEGRKIQKLLELPPIPAPRLQQATQSAPMNRIRLWHTLAGDSRAELVGAGVGARLGGHFAGVHPCPPRCFGILPADDQGRSVEAPGVGAVWCIDRAV